MKKIKDKLWVEMVDFFMSQPFEPEVRANKDSLFKKELVENYLLFPTQFLYVYDFVDVQMTYVSPNIKNVLGYEPEDFTIEELYYSVHPDDRAKVCKIGFKSLEWAFKNVGEEIINETLSIEYRMKRKDNKFIKVLRQSSVLTTDSKGNMVHALSVVTDLTHKNLETNIIKYIYDKNVEKIQEFNISPRELDILKLLSQGKSSKEISNRLFLSIHTIEKHRKNMLHKNNLKNTAELIRLAQENLII